MIINLIYSNEQIETLNKSYKHSYLPYNSMPFKASLSISGVITT